MVDKVKNNINLIYTAVGLLIVIAGWISNYTVMQERISYIEQDKNQLKKDICDIKEQIKDYNVLIYKVDKIDLKLDKLLVQKDIRDNEVRH